MIIDQIENAEVYFKINKRIKTALAYLKQNDFTNTENGKYEIEGEDIFSIVSEYKTKKIEEAVWEAHKKYIDVQFIFSGNEKIGRANISEMTLFKTYDEANDFALFTGKGDFYTANPKTFLILFPHDVHMPGVAIEPSQPVKKVVVKVKL